MNKINDNKIDQKSCDIAYFNSLNGAIELVKTGKFNEDEEVQNFILKWRDFFYQEWVKWRNEVEARSEIKKCPTCGSPLKVVPAGVSKKTGNAYSAFEACDSCGYKKSLEIKKAEPTSKGAVEVETPMPEKL